MLLSSVSYAEPQLTLTLEDAILLGLREHPNVQKDQLDLVLKKFSVWVEHWKFHPHYGLSVLGTTTQTIAPNLTQYSKGWTVTPKASLNTPIGTHMELTPVANSSSNSHGGYDTSLSLTVTQPLMRGFGQAIVEADLYNALDNEKIFHLNMENTLRTTVTGIINAYLDVLSAQRTLKVDQEALQRSENSVKQTKLFIQAGRKAGVELVTVQAAVATAKNQIEVDSNQLQQMQYALLTAIGLDPETKMTIVPVNIDCLVKRYHVPTLNLAKQQVLEKNTQYQVDQIVYEGSTKRALLTAEDNTRWKLDLEATGMVGQNDAVSSSSNGIQSILSPHNQTRVARVTLTIPIDNQEEKASLLAAKVALREAALALKYEKWAKENLAINGWNTINSAKRSLDLSQSSESLQQQNYQITEQKYQHGLIDSIELQSVQQQYVSQQQVLVGAQITYLKALVAMDELLGNTLKTWGVEVQNG